MRQMHKPNEQRTEGFGWQMPVVLVLGILLGAFAARALSPAAPPPLPEPQVAPVLVRAGAVGLSHPILACTSAATLPTQLAVLQAEVTGILEAARAQGLTRAGAYVMDLEACQSFAIGAEERFHPASMLKLPIAMAWLRRLGTDPVGLQQQIKYDVTTPFDPKEDPNAPEALKPGESYTIETLLKHMLIDSRNDAKWLLGKHLPPDQFDAVFRDLGLPTPNMKQDVALRPSDVGKLLEALYDGTAMGPKASELALKWLTAATWRDGLMGQLPADAVVAHKYGRRALAAVGMASDIAQRDADGKVIEVPARPGEPAIQLSDCGILYRPGRPVLACIMTEGLNEAVVTQTLQKIGKTVWEWSGK